MTTPATSAKRRVPPKTRAPSRPSATARRRPRNTRARPCRERVTKTAAAPRPARGEGHDHVLRRDAGDTPVQPGTSVRPKGASAPRSRASAASSSSARLDSLADLESHAVLEVELDADERPADRFLPDVATTSLAHPLPPTRAPAWRWSRYRGTWPPAGSPEKSSACAEPRFAIQSRPGSVLRRRGTGSEPSARCARSAPTTSITACGVAQHAPPHG